MFSMSGWQESLPATRRRPMENSMKHLSRRLPGLLLTVLLYPVLSLTGQALSAERVLHPFLAAQPKNAPEEALLAVEIPAGSFTKYEINEEGLVFVDRFQSMPVAYPANYGSMPRTLAGDG